MEMENQCRLLEDNAKFLKTLAEELMTKRRKVVRPAPRKSATDKPAADKPTADKPPADIALDREIRALEARAAELDKAMDGRSAIQIQVCCTCTTTTQNTT